MLLLTLRHVPINLVLCLIIKPSFYLSSAVSTNLVYKSIILVLSFCLYSYNFDIFLRPILPNKCRSKTTIWLYSEIPWDVCKVLLRALETERFVSVKMSNISLWKMFPKHRNELRTSKLCLRAKTKSAIYGYVNMQLIVR